MSVDIDPDGGEDAADDEENAKNKSKVVVECEKHPSHFPLT